MGDSEAEYEGVSGTERDKKKKWFNQVRSRGWVLGGFGVLGFLRD